MIEQNDPSSILLSISGVSTHQIDGETLRASYQGAHLYFRVTEDDTCASGVALLCALRPSGTWVLLTDIVDMSLSSIQQALHHARHNTTSETKRAAFQNWSQDIQEDAKAWFKSQGITT